jgi:hypothetical protein
MLDEFDFGTTPIDEACTQAPYIGDNYKAAFAEAEQLVAMLNKRFLNLPFPMRFITKSRPYDEFYYYVVTLRYDDNDRSNMDALNFIEDHFPSQWSDKETYDLMKEIR